MASFMEDLWQSIFTPGPTSTLVIATNVTFAALQLVLLTLLVATYSIHFVVLSVLCAGLWGSINWFAKEVQAAQAAQDKAKHDEAVQAGQKNISRDGEATETGDELNNLEDTETESGGSTMHLTASRENLQNATLSTSGEALFVDPVAASTGFAHGLAPGDTSGNLKHRIGKTLAESTGDLSASGTDSEWEKVEEDR